MRPRGLPGDRLATLNGAGPACPWCGEAVGQATVRLDAVLEAWCERQLAYAPRDGDGQVSASALTAECPWCAKPFVVALQTRRELGPCMRLLAVRTAADVEMLARGCGT